MTERQTEPGTPPPTSPTNPVAEPNAEPNAEKRPRKQEQLPASEEIAEVGPGVLRLQVPIFFTGLGHVNCYALIDKRGATIVDAGMPGKATWQALTKRLAAAGLKVRDIHTVIVTHSHPDHFGSAGRLAHEAGADLVTERRFRTWLEPQQGRRAARTPPRGDLNTGDGHPAPGQGAGVRAGAGGQSTPDGCEEIIAGAAAEDGDDDTGFFSPRAGTPWGGSPIPHLRRNLWMTRLARLHLLRFVRPPVPTRLVTSGDHLKLAGRDWHVVHTPGHTSDHLCLYDPEEALLISGDHVLPTITPHVPGMSPLGNPLKSYMTSLEALRGLGDVRQVLPAHGDTFSDLSGRIDQILDHHSARLAELQQIVADHGPVTVVDISHEMFRKPIWGMMAESETYAHAEYLRLAGQIERLDLGGQAAYRLP